MSTSNRYNILVITTGQESYEKGLAKLQAFVPNQNICQVGAQALPVGAASKVPNQGLTAVNVGRKIDAIRGMPESQCGAWVQRTLQAREGLVVQVFGSRRARWNSLLSSSNFYLRMRNGAAHRKVTMKTLQISGMSELQQVSVEGRFDVLTLPEAAVQGVTPNPLYRALFSLEKYQYLFQEEILEGESAARERVVTTTVLSENGTTEEASVSRVQTLIEL